MNVKQYLDHCNEQNWQVNDQNEKIPTNKYNGNDSESMIMKKSILEERVYSLKKTISVLKSELLEEKALWKKEIELTSNLLSSMECSPDSDLNFDPEIDVKSITNNSLSTPDTLMATPLNRDFEEKLSKYQGTLAQMQAEKRLNIRRQIAANTYKKRLSEVEKLCQEELNKVRETATYLEPLKQIASEWNKIECGGDFLLCKGKETQTQEELDFPHEVPVKQIDANLVMDEDATSEIKGKIVLQIGSLPTEYK
ncbi:hypothetical protein Phum_PHUM391750 [Pediculus humanus corporis]|uniref:Uncharacterized protein n=1 Tax=Pediculus humanus subsp. corporis TaxID=121224 RepID=E0VR34_PEDHC|nr:uncharacterized protein Phum_PHUM391750 [Pediculus humanus corporis]EEB15840.1 hypothetical protein Phum_PHUM391750 [Pediculus humanus corporis]